MSPLVTRLKSLDAKTPGCLSLSLATRLKPLDAKAGLLAKRVKPLGAKAGLLATRLKPLGAKACLQHTLRHLEPSSHFAAGLYLLHHC